MKILLLMFILFGVSFAEDNSSLNPKTETIFQNFKESNNPSFEKFLNSLENKKETDSFDLVQCSKPSETKQSECSE